MNIISFIGGSHAKVENYQTRDLIRAISALKPERVIVTMDGEFRSKDSEYSLHLQELVRDPSLSGNIVFANPDESMYQRIREDFFRRHSDSADTVVKRNILEMIDTTVNSYLEGYWKDFETVNSEVTDSLFRAKHKIVSTMFWEVERDSWNAMMGEVFEKIQKMSPGPGDIVIVDVEKRYWLADKLSEA